MSHQLKATLESLEGQLAVLKTEDGNTITVPQNNLPENFKIGELFQIIITRENNIAKQVLNEILNAEEPSQQSD